MKTSFETKGVCASRIDFELDGDIIKHVQFSKGCDGNLKAVASLVVGMKASEAAAKLRGITCDRRPTSCPDQLARALEGVAKV